MPDRIRIYHPETNEAFDLPVDKANDLRLNHGWLSQPLDSTAVPAVQNVEPEESGIDTSEDDESDEEIWPDDETD